MMNKLSRAKTSSLIYSSSYRPSSCSSRLDHQARPSIIVQEATSIVLVAQQSARVPANLGLSWVTYAATKEQISTSRSERDIASSIHCSRRTAMPRFQARDCSTVRSGYDKLGDTSCLDLRPSYRGISRGSVDVTAWQPEREEDELLGVGLS